ncbi:site-specific integrase [Pseudoclavibacter sp. CFCC 14310]|uniref:tyrosine-type recombinase/integrase n=1 Tax=Pseudoclavibacter sp. CFCC 14310 TaxID=2615180 RepID=UPI0013010CB3|nr:tyrosine-type recombinase/integrase [Pseudoclavibacter sp. CFCC 14310]KAB1647127.1 site-specific integrase [Pseudoclavibacter sp. CFCC 14310]
MASIEPYQTKAGKRWRVRYRKPDHSSTDKRGFTTKRDAQQWLATVQVADAQGAFVDPALGRAKVASLAEAWLDTKKQLKPSSYAPLEAAWRNHVEPVWGHVALRSITFSAVQQWVSKLSDQGKSPTVVIRAFGVLHGIITTAIRDHRITIDPCAGVQLPRKTEKPRRYLSHEQVAALASASGERALLVLVLAYTGLRWGEAIALRRCDLDAKRGRVRVTRAAIEVGSTIHVGEPKTYEHRDVPVPAFLLERLTELSHSLQSDSLLFPGDSGQFLHRPGTGAKKRSWYKTALTHAGLEPMTVHDLRHTAASLAISAGANVKAVQRMLGHASASVTLDTYSDLFDTDLDAVGNALNHAARAAGVGKLWAESTVTKQEESPAPQ